jgi:hypothetical protein
MFVARILLALALLSSACCAAGAQTSERRKANDPAANQPGLYLNAYAKALQEPDQTQRLREGALGDDIPRRLQEEVRTLDPDRLAEMYVASFEGLMSVHITIGVMRALHQGGEQDFGQTLMRSSNVVHFPSGEELALPLAKAPTYHLLSLRLSGAERHARGGWAELGGTYAMESAGDCEFASGPVQVAQKDFLLEVVRDGRLLLFGAIGAQTARFVANGQRYGRVIGRSLHVPDAPSEAFDSDVIGARMTLSARERKTCRLTLSRAP